MKILNANIELSDNKLILVILGLTIISISNFIGQFLAPFSIFASPIVLPIILGIINASLYKANYYITVLYGFGLLLINDILIRLFAGGEHDDGGKAWIMLFFIITTTIGFMTMSIFAFNKHNSETWKKKAFSIFTKIVFTIVVLVFVGFFYEKYLLKF